jgi:hypothetical protein
MADDDDGPPQPDKESIRRDGEMVACSCSMKSIEKGGKKQKNKTKKTRNDYYKRVSQRGQGKVFLSRLCGNSGVLLLL